MVKYLSVSEWFWDFRIFHFSTVFVTVDYVPLFNKVVAWKSSLVLYSPHLNTKRQKPHNGSLSCANNSKQTAWTPHKSELSRSPSNGRHAVDSSACSSPRHNRNDWFPAEAEAQGAHSPPWGSLNPPCDKLFRWTYCVRNKTLRVNAEGNVSYHG